MDFSAFTDLEIGAGTLIGESETLGEQGMTENACVLQNRMKANEHFMGGSTLRGVCLAPGQFDCWLVAKDLSRILDIINNNPLYGPYALAMSIVSTLTNYSLEDITNGAVSYFDPPANPAWAFNKEDGSPKTPCHVNGTRKYYDLKAVLTP